MNLILRISQLTKKLNNYSSLKNSFEFKEKNEITGNYANEIEKRFNGFTGKIIVLYENSLTKMPEKVILCASF